MRGRAIDAPMRIVGSSVVRAPVDEVWAWWTDFGEPGAPFPVSHGLVRSTREVLSRDADHVEYRERFAGGLVRYTVSVTIDRKARLLRERHLGGLPWAYAATWRFEPEDGGRATRVTREMDAHVPGPGALLELGQPVSRRMIETDIRAHLREFLREREGGGAR